VVRKVKPEIVGAMRCHPRLRLRTVRIVFAGLVSLVKYQRRLQDKQVPNRRAGAPARRNHAPHMG
jgi:hypothetical protein